MNLVDPQEPNDDKISVDQYEDLISVESMDSTSTTEDVSVEGSIEKEEEKSETPEGQTNRKVSSSIKLFQTLGLPTFETEDPGNQCTTTMRSASYWNALYVFPVIAICICAAFYITLIPYRNLLEFPNYWFQLALMCLFIPIWILYIFDQIICCYYCFNLEQLISFPTFFRLYIPTTSAPVILYCVLMIIWTLVLGYNPPLPFSQLVFTLFGLTVVTVQEWLELSAILKTVEGRK